MYSLRGLFLIVRGADTLTPHSTLNTSHLVGHLHHSETDNLFADLEALLEDLGDDVLAKLFRIDVHHGVVQVGVELIAHIAEDFYAQGGEDLHQLIHGHLHALLVGGILGGLVQRPFQVVVDGKL